MKKAIFAVFAAVLSVALTVSILGGCDHELLLHGTGVPTTVPSLTTLPDIDPPETLTGTLPPDTDPPVGTTPTGTIPTEPTTQISETRPITEPTIPEDYYLNYSLCTADADKRAASQDWICLNDYVQLLGWDRPYLTIFDANNKTAISRMNLTTLSYSRAVRVCGVELTFSNGVLSLSDDIQYGGTAVDLSVIPEICADVELYSDSLYLPGNTLWLEPTTNETGRGFGDFWDESTTLRTYLLSDSLVQVRIFGTLLPAIEEVRAPSHMPYGVSIVDMSKLPKYYRLSYYQSEREIAFFEQTPIYGSLQLPEGSVSLMQFAGRNVVRVSYAWDPDVYDLYWDDGEYRYQLWGKDEEMLQKLAESIVPLKKVN